ncbi:hypothetical protein [uncultured Phenylobacterium sp.]|uniref:hypothetical protein n=1 Tax=uncultured Phenylobacterium sp. TaxID=349273 RepID=UPI0025CBAC8D|nr:hypothetical protein [uncultured Phenylobacterium sp.]
MKRIWIAPAITLALAGDAAAREAPVGVLCCGAKYAMTFMGASPDVKGIVLILWAAALGSVVVWVRALRRIARAPTDTAPRTLAFLSAWRAGGPLLGAACAAHVLVAFFVAVYAYPPVSKWQEYAPGLAEVSMVLGAGFVAGAIATLTFAHLRGRIGRPT